jgi:hypothetical protein
MKHVGLVTQKLVLGFGDTGGSLPIAESMRIVVLVTNALAHAGTGGIDTVVVVDNS